ncbi:MAG: DUF2076 domain-containing protein [Hyphomicrobiales bacterium]|nr:DUF2076 domain-containing protein [Hyphomicrobiales bacterium]
MTPDERQMLADLFERIKATSATPRDAQAEAFINDAVRAAPFAPYVLAQTVLVQQHALEAAASRIAELEAATRQAAEGHQEQGSFLGNLGRSIFGGGPSASPPPPQRAPAPPPPGYAPPQQQAYGTPPASPYAPQPQPGPWGAPQPGRGGGFLANAASTAAGVAGGVALGNLLGGLFGGHSGGMFGGGFGGAGFPGGGNETVNIFEQAPDQGQGNVDNAGFDQGQFDPGAPDDAGYIDDSSFDDSSGGGYDDV